MIFIRTMEPDRQDGATGSWQAANLTHVNWVLVPNQVSPLVLHIGDMLAHWQLAYQQIGIGILFYFLHLVVGALPSLRKSSIVANVSVPREDVGQEPIGGDIVVSESTDKRSNIYQTDRQINK